MNENEVKGLSGLLLILLPIVIISGIVLHHVDSNVYVSTFSTIFGVSSVLSLLIAALMWNNVTVDIYNTEQYNFEKAIKFIKDKKNYREGQIEELEEALAFAIDNENYEAAEQLTKKLKQLSK